MNCKKKSNIIEVCNYLNQAVSDVLLSLTDAESEKLSEIRIKAELPVILIFTDSKQFITKTGRMTEIYSDNLLCLSRDELDRCFCRMCEYSVHSHSQSIAKGFISLKNGCRVGVYGTAVIHDGKVQTIRDIRGMNIRISGEFDDCAEEIFNMCFVDGVKNTIICGPPSSGKTTILKGLCRILSDSCQKKLAVIDERYEMSSSYLGYFTDVLSDYPKQIGIEIAVRTLSPDIIIFDELGNANEVNCVTDALNSGVKFITSIHCKNENELIMKKQYQILKEINAIECCAFIDRNYKLSKILRVNNNENSGTDNTRNKLCYERSIHCIQI